MKKLGLFLGIIVLALGAAYMFRAPLALELIGLRTAMGSDVGPNVPIEWQTGKADTPLEERPPNIILIVADDLGWNDLTINGGFADGTVPTHNIDALARDGAFFTNGHSGSGTCAPSRAALMSGRYPTRFGFEFTPTPPGMLKMVSSLGGSHGDQPEAYYTESDGGEVSFEDMGMPPSEITLAEILKDKGYHTSHIGKWHLGRNNGMAPQDQGFDESLLMASGLYMNEKDPGVVNSKQGFDPIDRFLWKALRWAASFNGGGEFEPDGYLTDYYTQEAVKTIEANKDRPFFLYLAHWAVHTPLQASKADYDAVSHIPDHRARVYAGMIRSLDRSVGEITAKLQELGLEENTLVIFTSDNGGPGYIGLPEINDPYRGWKITYFEGGIHVPYFVKWPSKIPAGVRNNDPVHHFDAFATAVAAAGGKAPTDRKIDGVDLVPFVSPVAVGETELTPTNTSSEEEEGSAPHEILFWKGGHYQVAKTSKWKLQRAERPDKIWLFNMESDPTEQDNVADQNPEVVAQLMAKLDAHISEQMPSRWPSQLEAPIQIDKSLEKGWEDGDEHIYWPN